MKKSVLMSLCAAALILSGAGAVAQQQTPSQPVKPTGSQSSPTRNSSADRASVASAITLIGCVQRQADYLRSQNAGSGRVGTGVGGSNEFVLIQTTVAGDSTASLGTGVQPNSPVQLGSDTQAGISASRPDAQDAHAPAPGSQSSTTTGQTTVAPPIQVGGTIGLQAGPDANIQAGTQSSVGTSGSATAYSLSGHAADLQRHVGKRVEITGSTKANAGRSTAPGANGQAGMSANLQVLTVTAVREVAGSCEGH